MGGDLWVQFSVQISFLQYLHQGFGQ